MPVPKPVSPITRRPSAGSAAKRAGRSLQARNTWRVSPSPSSREKYTSPNWRDSGWPCSSQSSWALGESDIGAPGKEVRHCSGMPKSVVIR